MVASAAGLVVFVTIRRDGPVHIHHISVSVRGGPTVDAVGRTFSVFIWAARVVTTPVGEDAHREAVARDPGPGANHRRARSRSQSVEV